MAESAEASIAEPLEKTVRRRKRRKDEKPKRQPRYQVILWDDNHHTYAYVVVLTMEIFGYPPEKGYQIACEVDTSGRAICMTTTREHAELKRDQIHAFGKDDLIDKCCGSMWSTIEPLEAG